MTRNLFSRFLVIAVFKIWNNRTKRLASSPRKLWRHVGNYGEERRDQEEGTNVLRGRSTKWFYGNYAALRGTVPAY